MLHIYVIVSPPTTWHVGCKKPWAAVRRTIMVRGTWTKGSTMWYEDAGQKAAGNSRFSTSSQGLPGVLLHRCRHILSTL